MRVGSERVAQAALPLDRLASVPHLLPARDAMPILLLLPLLVMFLALLWVLLLPIALWQRYRLGKTRRRAIGWLVRLNAALLLVSAGLFVVGAWLSGYWVKAALPHAVGGLGAGLLLGVVGLVATRFEVGPQGLFYTPNRWLVLSLTLIVAARLAFAALRLWQSGQDGAYAAWLAQQGGMLAVGGLLLGHYLAYAWGLRRRLRAG